MATFWERAAHSVDHMFSFNFDYLYELNESYKIKTLKNINIDIITYTIQIKHTGVMVKQQLNIKISLAPPCTRPSYTTQNLISINLRFEIFSGYPGDEIPKILLQICSTTIAL